MLYGFRDPGHKLWKIQRVSRNSVMDLTKFHDIMYDFDIGIDRTCKKCKVTCQVVSDCSILPNRGVHTATVVTIRNDAIAVTVKRESGPRPTGLRRPNTL